MKLNYYYVASIFLLAEWVYFIYSLIHRSMKIEIIDIVIISVLGVIGFLSFKKQWSGYGNTKKD